MFGDGDEFEYESDGRDAPLADDLDDGDDSFDESVCPACGAVVSELTDKCPSCGQWIVHDWRARRRKWVIAAIAVVLIVGLFWWTVL